MNVILHSLHWLFILLIISFFGGFILSIVCSVLSSFSLFMWTIKCKGFVAYKYFKEYMSSCCTKRKNTIVLDFTNCILFAIMLLGITFVYNSGIFRLISVPITLLGVITGNILLSRMISRIMLFLVFVAKWTVEILLFPFLWIVKRICRIITRSYGKLRNTYNSKLMQKFTDQCFERISKDAEYGLLNGLFKEMKNERTF